MKKDKFSIGIMQGRLTQPRGRGIQFFPFDYWEQEFYDAKAIGVDEIEFIFDYDQMEENPFWTDKGIEKLQLLIKDTGVTVHAVCFDYFMRRPFYKTKDLKTKEENTKVIRRVIWAMEQLNISLIEIPLVDDSSLKTEAEKTEFRLWLKSIIAETPECIRFGLETDLPPKEFAMYIDSFEEKRLGANYDSGNSSSLGYNMYEEITILKDRIYNIHIKDRIYQGKTVPLGTGDTDFKGLFKGLNEINYEGSFILQAARAEEGREQETIKEQIRFVKKYADEILLG